MISKKKRLSTFKMYRFVIILLIALIFIPVKSNAAAFKQIEEQDNNKGIKVGKYWFRAMMQEKDGNWCWFFQYSKKSARSGFNTLLEGENIGGSFVTNGSKIFYLQGRILKALTIKSGKIQTVAKIPKDSRGNYWELNGCENGKIWLLLRSGSQRGLKLYYYQISTKKLKLAMKNFMVWNAPAHSRYLLVTTGKLSSSGAENTLKVYDKKTLKTKVIAQNALAMVYASGGGGYDRLGKWTIYGWYDKNADAWKIIQYTFATGKKRVLATVKEDVKTIFWFGDGARVIWGDDINDTDNSLQVKAV